MGNRYTKVSNIKEIRRGDHVSYKNGWFYHHAIVTQVDLTENTLIVIHYLHNSVGSKSDAAKFLDHPAISYARVREEVIDFGLYATRDKLYRYMYEDHECVSADEVLARARSHLDKSKFNVQYNNCEDFAVRCKTSAPPTAALQMLVSLPAAQMQGVAGQPVQVPQGVAAVSHAGALLTMGGTPIVGSAPVYVTTPSADIVMPSLLEEKSKLYELD